MENHISANSNALPIAPLDEQTAPAAVPAQPAVQHQVGCLIEDLALPADWSI